MKNTYSLWIIYGFCFVIATTSSKHISLGHWILTNWALFDETAMQDVFDFRDLINFFIMFPNKKKNWVQGFPEFLSFSSFFFWTFQILSGSKVIMPQWAMAWRQPWTSMYCRNISPQHIGFLGNHNTICNHDFEQFFQLCCCWLLYSDTIISVQETNTSFL